MLRIAWQAASAYTNPTSAQGNLFITVRVEPHPFFDRDDILIKIPVSVSEAGFGAKIEVPTIDGRALLKIPQGVKNGQKKSGCEIRAYMIHVKIRAEIRSLK